MAKQTLPSQKVLQEIAKQKQVKSPSAKKSYEKALTILKSRNEKVRDVLDRDVSFHLKLISEMENRIQVIGEETNGWIEINPEVYQALYSSEGFKVTSQTTVTVEDGWIKQLQKDGTKTALSAKQLRKVRSAIFGADAGRVDLGHDTGIATKRMEVTLNVLRSIPKTALPPAEKAQIIKLESAVKKAIELLNSIDKLEAKLARKLFSNRKELLQQFLTYVREGSIGVPQVEVLSTTAENFTPDDLMEKRTEFILEDRDLNRNIKGKLAGDIIGGLSNYIYKELTEARLTDAEAALKNYLEEGESPSLVDTVRLKILNAAVGKKYKPQRRKTKPLSKKSALFTKRRRFKTRPINPPRIAAMRSKNTGFAEAGRILGFINKQLPATIMKNMGRPSLENQTGRFARSAEVVSAIPDRRGLITFNYTYDERYRVFEPEHNDGKYPSSYDPRDLISRSIRDLAIAQAQFKFITRRV